MALDRLEYEIGGGSEEVQRNVWKEHEAGFWFYLNKIAFRWANLKASIIKSSLVIAQIQIPNKQEISSTIEG